MAATRATASRENRHLDSVTLEATARQTFRYPT
jgi:hypothetical protein